MNDYLLLLNSGVLFAISVSLIAIVLLFAFIVNKLHSYQKELEKFKTQTKDVVGQAQNEYLDILDSANKKAEEMIANSVNSGDKLRKLHGESFEKLAGNQQKTLLDTSKQLLESYKKDMDKLNNDNINILNNISKDIVRYSNSQLEDFKRMLQEETLSSQKIVGDKIEKDYNELQKKLEAYKEEKLKKVDENIIDILLVISKQTIGRTLSFEDHRDLILEALDKAKQKGGLS